MWYNKIVLAVRIVKNKKVKIRLSEILFNICFITLAIFLLASSANTANAQCCVPVNNPAGNCFLPTNGVCPSLPQSVYHSSSCSSISECGIGGGTGAGTGTGSSGKCEAGFTEYAGVCFPDDTGLSEMSVWTIAVNAMRWILGIFGFIALIAFAISGMQYLTSAGNENAIETAKRNMKWSIIGVIVGLGGLVIILAIDWALRGIAYF